MMERGKQFRKDIGTVVRAVVFCLLGIQIVLGVLWSCINLAEIPLFGETAELEEISRTFYFDGYSGVLYPVLIRLAGVFESFLPLKYCVILYLLQLLVAFIVYRDFQKKVFGIDDNKKNTLFALYAMTVPTVLQCHMAVLPYSLASSVFLWMVSHVICLWREKDFLAKRLICICGGWMISAALIPDYAWIGAVTVVIGFLGYMVQHRKFAVKLVIAMIFTALSIGVFQNMFLKDNPEKIQRTVGAAMVSRVVWPDFLTYDYFWSPEIRAVWDDNGMLGLAYAPEKVIYEFGPVMEQTYGKEFANDTYWSMAKIAFSVGTRKIVGEIGVDFASYICPPATMYFQLKGIGCSFTGWNYGRMTDYTPELAKAYVTFSLKSWFCIGLLSILYWIFFREKKLQPEKMEKGEKKWQFIFLMLISLLINIWYVMSKGHMQDYRYAIVISVLWALGFARCLSSNKG